ncbi:MAG: hypothetical protein NWQ13_00390 [Glaciimonas sp.]|nr:hypothetical protein [Glaciimonas sp.]
MRIGSCIPHFFRTAQPTPSQWSAPSALRQDARDFSRDFKTVGNAIPPRGNMGKELTRLAHYAGNFEKSVTANNFSSSLKNVKGIQKHAERLRNSYSDPFNRSLLEKIETVSRSMGDRLNAELVRTIQRQGQM